MSTPEAIVARVAQILASGLTQSVERARFDPIARREGDYVCVSSSDEESEAFADNRDKTTFIFTVEYVVRGAPWETAANAVADQAHALILGDSQLAQLVARVRRHSAKWEGHEADLTAGVLTRQYRCIFLTPAGSL